MLLPARTIACLCMHAAFDAVLPFVCSWEGSRLFSVYISCMPCWRPLASCDAALAMIGKHGTSTKLP